MTFSPTTTRALTLFRDKKFDETEALCREILQTEEANAVALHLLAMIVFSKGAKDEAETLMRRSLASPNPMPEMYFTFGYVLIDLGKNDEAIDVLRQGLAQRPNAEAFHTLGNELHKKGRLDEADDAWREALRLRPAYPEALNSVGASYCRQEKYIEAEAYFQKALAARPTFHQALNNLGIVAYKTESYEAAAHYCLEALALNPNYASGYNNLGNVRNAQGLTTDAEACYRKALDLTPNDLDVMNNLGVVLIHDPNTLEEGIKLLRYVTEQDPHNKSAFTNYGVALYFQGKFEESLACHKASLAIDPAYNNALNNIGNIYKALGQTKESIDAYRKALALKPNSGEFKHNLSMSLLMDGEYLEGWSLYESRWETKQLKAATRKFTQPQWKGEAANGRTLLIYAEQGFGDSLQFCRYAPMAVERGFKVILEVPPRLARLMENLKADIHVVERETSHPPFDCHCAIMSLPHAFRTTVETIPAPIPYLFARDEDIATWKERLNQTSAKRLHEQALPAPQENTYGGDCRRVREDEAHAASERLHEQASSAPQENTYGGDCRRVREDEAHAASERLHEQASPAPQENTYGGDCRRVREDEAHAASERLHEQASPAPQENTYGGDCRRVREDEAHAASERLKIGLVWSGNSERASIELKANASRRSLDPTLLAPLFELENIDFYSLQKDGPEAPKDLPLIHLMQHAHDFADTAAFIMNLDLVITVDTAVAHLAGGLGKPVWIMNRFDTCWRWFQKRTDSPWYPNARLFRQPKPGDWTSVVADIRTALQNKTAS